MENIYSKEKIEESLKEINCYGEYNYYFTCQVEQSILPMLFGIVGALIAAAKNNNIMGYIFNKTDKGICLIPIVVDKVNKNKIDLENYIFIKEEDIEKVVIKNEDITFKNIKIVLKDKTKYKMRTSKKIKNIDYHEENLNKVIEIYK